MVLIQNYFFGIDDVHGAQKTAERCMSLVTEAILREHAASLSADGSEELKRLSPRVWRWVSVCERYFGVAISKIIQSEGQVNSNNNSNNNCHMKLLLIYIHNS